MTTPNQTSELPRRVLFLEDQLLIAIDTGETLSELGIETVRVCHTLAAAEDACVKETFDLAILDINVDCNQQSYGLGQEFLNKGVPVIFASGTEIERARLCKEGYQFLPKPYAKESLRETILKALQDPVPAKQA